MSDKENRGFIGSPLGILVSLLLFLFLAKINIDELSLVEQVPRFLHESVDYILVHFGGWILLLAAWILDILLFIVLVKRARSFAYSGNLPIIYLLLISAFIPAVSLSGRAVCHEIAPWMRFAIRSFSQWEYSESLWYEYSSFDFATYNLLTCLYFVSFLSFFLGSLFISLFPDIRIRRTPTGLFISAKYWSTVIGSRFFPSEAILSINYVSSTSGESTVRVTTKLGCFETTADGYTCDEECSPREALPMLPPGIDLPLSFTELWLSQFELEHSDSMKTECGFRGQYKITQELGRGGQGVCYLASKENGNENVVLKEFLLPIHQGKEALAISIRNFETYASMLSTIKHERIASLVDCFFENMKAYYVFEHVAGRTLSEIVSEDGPVDPFLVLQIATQVSDSIEYLHRFSPPLIHQDISPDNIVYDDRFGAKLIDITSVTPESATASNKIIGNLNFMSVEQLRGFNNLSNDIHSFGKTLYFLLTGKINEPLSDLDCSVLTEPLQTFIAKCTSSTVEDRFQSISDLRLNLDLLSRELIEVNSASTSTPESQIRIDNVEIQLKQIEELDY